MPTDLIVREAHGRAHAVLWPPLLPAPLQLVPASDKPPASLPASLPACLPASLPPPLPAGLLPPTFSPHRLLSPTHPLTHPPTHPPPCRCFARGRQPERV